MNPTVRNTVFRVHEVSKNSKKIIIISLFQAEALERNSVLQLRLLVQYSVEALELWRELCEYQFHLVAERLPAVKLHF